ncbi:hypothetical protein [Curtobacterium pusillum]|uniref:hypothetical protein n=1 Tax=Curtobacterium pusillum TaxID=69373 RepID=UPI0011A79DF0|nr:hypothetical protein [Curtobacterium pusillum]
MTAVDPRRLRPGAIEVDRVDQDHEVHEAASGSEESVFQADGVRIVDALVPTAFGARRSIGWTVVAAILIDHGPLDLGSCSTLFTPCLLRSSSPAANLGIGRRRVQGFRIRNPDAAATPTRHLSQLTDTLVS